MFLIVGLGNPGKIYESTWHNMGFLVVDNLMEELKNKGSRIACQSIIVEARLGDRKLILAKPLTFMNRSGFGVKQLLRRFGLDVEDMIVVHDDVDLDPETVRIKQGGGHGGHKGIRSIIDHLGSPDFIRVRVGIGRPPDGTETSDYVLTRIDNDMWDQTRAMIQLGSSAVKTVLTRGPIQAMNIFNRRIKPENT